MKFDGVILKLLDELGTISIDYSIYQASEIVFFSPSEHIVSINNTNRLVRMQLDFH